MDHWHSAYLIHHCGIDLPMAGSVESPDGIHTHGDGLIHIHPFTPEAAGSNATFGVFVNSLGSELTDESYTPGFAEDTVLLSEEAGCEGEPAVLQLAVWADAASDEPPVVVTEGLTEQRFEVDGAVFTLALLPAGAEIPKPPADRLASLAAVLP